MADFSQPVIDPRLPGILRANAEMPPPVVGQMAMPMGAPAPQLPSLSLPNVSRIPTQTETDQSKLNALVSTGAGVDNIHNGILHGVAKTANVFGTVASSLFPALRPVLAAIPGTTENFRQHVGTFRANLANDQKNDLGTAQVEDSQAQADQRRALATQEQAKAESLLNPQSKSVPGHLVISGDGSAAGYADGEGNLHGLNDPAVPQGARDVAAGMAGKSTKSPEQAAYDAAFAQNGGDALKAFSAVKQASNTRDATLQQQFLDGYRKAHPEASDTDAIAATIRATQTEPRIEIHQASGSGGQSSAGSDATVQAIVEGRIPAPNVRTKQGMALMQAVTAADPTYDASRYNTYQASQKDATSGKTGAAINSLNTIQEHIGRALGNIPHNGDSPFLNSIENTVSSATGGNPTGKFDVDATGIAGEWGKLVAGGVASEGEQKHVQSLLNKNGSPKQIRDNLEEVRQMTLGKLQGIQRQIQSGSHPGAGNNPVSSLPSGVTVKKFNPSTGRLE